VRLALALFIAAQLQAQVIASFSPGVKLSRGVYRWGVTVCSTYDLNLDSGWVYQAADRSGIPTLTVTESIRLATKSRNSDPLVMSFTGMTIGTQLGAYLIDSGTIKADPKVAGYMLAASGAVALVQVFLGPHLPPDYAANLLSGTVMVSAKGCVQRDILARTMHNPQPVQVDVRVP
jgi:hypothetical protein